MEREPQLCAALSGLKFRQDWVLGQPAAALADLALAYAQQVQATDGIALRLGTRAESARHAAGAWTLQLATGEHVQSRAPCSLPPACGCCGRRATLRCRTRACSTPPP